jgi:hypothetical protein
MPREAIEALLTADPFVPIRVYLNGGRTHLIRDPRTVSFSDDALIIHSPRRGRRPLEPSDFRAILSMDHIVRIRQCSDLRTKKEPAEVAE